MNESLRVACLGAGYFAQFQHKAWQRIEQCTLVGVCDSEVVRAQGSGVAAYAELVDMLRCVKPDILDIATPPSTHSQAITTAIEEGVKTVICQKPFCENLQQGTSIVAQADSAGVLLVIHENFRFQPWFRKIKGLLDEQLIGEVHQACFRLRTGDGQGPHAYLERQPYFQTMQRFLVHETAVHYIDTFRYLFGEARAVYADLSQRNPAISGEDAGVIIFDFPEQLQATFDGNRHLDFAASNTRLTFGDFQVEGPKGALTLHGDGRVMHRAHGTTKKRTLLEPQDWQGFAGDCVYALQQHVVSHLIDGTLLENTGADYLYVLQLEQKIYESHEKSAKLLLDFKGTN